MKNEAKLTGDVYDTRHTSPEGDFYFLLQEGSNRYTISLESVFEMLKVAEEENEIEPLPQSFWIGATIRYPNMYKGKKNG